MPLRLRCALRSELSVPFSDCVAANLPAEFRVYKFREYDVIDSRNILAGINDELVNLRSPPIVLTSQLVKLSLQLRF